jgi:hypothetical protein
VSDPTASPPSGGPPPGAGAPTGTLDADLPFDKVLDLVDRVVEAGRSKTLAVERASRIARKLPALLFGVTLAAAGLTLLVLASLRGLVEVTAAVFDGARPWVAWSALGGILLVVAVLVGTVRNTADSSHERP